MTDPALIAEAVAVEQIPVFVDEDHSAWRDMCLWLNERDRLALLNDGRGRAR